MSQQIPLCEVPTFNGESLKIPSAEYWLVAAYRTTSGYTYWRIFPDQWSTRRAAEEEARRRLNLGCWTAARLLHVRLEPKQAQGAAESAAEKETQENA